MFNNLKLRGRILAGYSVPILLSLGVAGIVHFNIQKVEQQFASVEEAHQILDDLKDVAFDVANMQKSSRGYMLQKTDASLTNYQDAKKEYEKVIVDLQKLIKDPEQQKNLTQITALGERVDNYNQKLISLVNQGKREEAIKIWQQGEGRKITEELKAVTLTFDKREREILDIRKKDEVVTLNSLRTAVYLGAFTAAILSIAIALWIASILSKMINKTVGMVASSSTEIAATVEQQERTVSQQASSVNETTTTMDELGASSRASAEQAEASAAGASQALSLAEGGTQAVHQTLVGMETLKEKVNAIAEQILRLSEQTTQIGSVSGLVGDLANQTNMLALNAAVEAARAGEHGKGFGVVAGEIRKLADQSKKSAEKINTLVTDIQTAINSTVMVTDEGTKNVDAGIKLVESTAESFTGVADSINSVFVNSQQISLSAKQQAVAVQQVVAAMNSINLGAKETASGITQVKTTTEQLKEAAQQLKAIV